MKEYVMKRAVNYSKIACLFVLAFLTISVSGCGTADPITVHTTNSMDYADSYGSPEEVSESNTVNETDIPYGNDNAFVSDEAGTSYVTVDRDVWVDMYIKEAESTHTNTWSLDGFCLVYINNDEVPELVFIPTAGTYGSQIYSFQMDVNGGHIEKGYFASGYGFCYHERGGDIISGVNNMIGYDVIRFENGKFKEVFYGYMLDSGKYIIKQDADYGEYRGYVDEDTFNEVQQHYIDWNYCVEAGIEYTSNEDLANALRAFPDTQICEYH